MVSEKVTEKFEFLNKEKEIQALNDKIQSLEIELAKAKGQLVKQATTTARTTKSTRTKTTTIKWTLLKH